MPLPPNSLDDRGVSPPARGSLFLNTRFLGVSRVARDPDLPRTGIFFICRVGLSHETPGVDRRGLGHHRLMYPAQRPSLCCIILPSGDNLPDPVCPSHNASSCFWLGISSPASFHPTLCGSSIPVPTLVSGALPVCHLGQGSPTEDQGLAIRRQEYRGWPTGGALQPQAAPGSRL